MIFYCGESPEAHHQRISNWHDYFCWLPITVGISEGRYLCVWLQTIERRDSGRYTHKVDFSGALIPTIYWEYRLKENASSR
jgi:hypothetical protein